MFHTSVLQKFTGVLPPVSLALLLITFPPHSFSTAAWVCVVPLLLYTWLHPNVGKSFLLWYTVSLIYWAIGVNAVVVAYGTKMYLQMIGAAALPMGLLGAGIAFSSRYKAIVRILVPSLLWMFFLNAFRLTSIQTMPLEVFFGQPLPLMQLVVTGNMDLLIFLILTTNAAIAGFLLYRDTLHTVALAVCLFLVATAYTWGFLRMQNSPAADGEIYIAIIQSNFPMSMSWREEHADMILESYKDWAKEAADHNVDMIVFPEYNLSRILSFDETVDLFSRIAQESTATVVLGTYSDIVQTPDGKKGQYNVGLTLTSTGMLLPVYRTNVNLPFRDIGELFHEGFEPVETPAGKAGLLVCYDDSSRITSQKWRDAGAQYFIVLTNPSTFAGPIITGLQFIQDQMRAIEFGTTIVRVGTNGPSAIIDSFGRIRILSKRDTQTILYGTIPNYR